MEADSREAVAARLEAVRAFHGVKTRREFAEGAGLTQQQYSDWMNYRRDLSLDAARKIAERYSLTLDFIYFGNKSHLAHSMAIAL